MTFEASSPSSVDSCASSTLHLSRAHDGPCSSPLSPLAAHSDICDDSDSSVFLGESLPFLAQNEASALRIAERARREHELFLSLHEPLVLRATAAELGLDRYDYFGDQYVSQSVHECVPEEDVAPVCTASASRVFSKDPSTRPHPSHLTRRAHLRIRRARTDRRHAPRVTPGQARVSVV